MILEVKISDFRKGIKGYFEAAKKGEKVIIKQGSDSFTLVPVSEDDLYFTPHMVDKIKKSMEQINNGQSKRIKNLDELRTLLKQQNV